MNNPTQIFHDAMFLIDEIDKNAEGMDKTTLLEAVMLSGEAFSKPVDASVLIQQLKDEGLLD
jgi:hypothetical protein